MNISLLKWRERMINSCIQHHGMDPDMIRMLTVPWKQNLSVRVLVAFRRNYIHSVDDFKNTPEVKIAGMEGLGPTSINFICERFGLPPYYTESPISETLISALRKLKEEYGKEEFCRAFRRSLKG